MALKYTLRKNEGDSLLDQLLFGRGIVDPTAREAFLSPDYDRHTHDPFLLLNMREAVARINTAIDAGERIAVYGDYDADGIPGTVVLHDFFKKIGYENVRYYIPHRHNEGFGLNEDAVTELAGEKVKLLITVDCGITDVDEVAHAKSLGVDVIVTDHHEPGPVLPDAFAIIDPKLPGCQYPEKMLCGAAVAFKLVSALVADDRARGEVGADGTGGSRWNIKEGWEKWLLDLVGLATLSDMVPLFGENRVLATYGLKVLRKTPRLGLMKLYKSLKIQPQHLVEDDIGFLITPRINAASRMASPMDAFALLTAADDTEADVAVKHLNHLNDVRKGSVAALVKDIRKKIELRDAGERPVTVLGNPDWQPPLLGLVANTLMRESGKPTFVWGRDDNGVIKGSCRASVEHDLVKLMHAVDGDIFIDRGGHKQSGGFSLQTDKVHLFEDALCGAFEKVYSSASAEAMDASIEGAGDVLLDAILFPNRVNNETMLVVDKLAPFGMANPKPLFLLKDVEVLSVKRFGKANDHFELTFIGDKGKKVSAIKFFVDEKDELLKLAEKSVVSLAVHLEKSYFKFYPEIRLRIVDVVA